MRRRLKGWDRNIRRWLGWQGAERQKEDQVGRRVEPSRRREDSSEDKGSSNRSESLFAPVLTVYSQAGDNVLEGRHNTSANKCLR